MALIEPRAKARGNSTVSYLNPYSYHLSQMALGNRTGC